jgi:choline dehydrogenase-like flavoprotein
VWLNCRKSSLLFISKQSNPSIWFYNVGGPLDWTLPIAPVPQLNNRQFNMALGRVLGGGSSVNAMVWTRGTQRDYDNWERQGATGWAFKDVLPTFKAQEDWEGDVVPTSSPPDSTIRTSAPVLESSPATRHWKRCVRLDRDIIVRSFGLHVVFL